MKKMILLKAIVAVLIFSLKECNAGNTAHDRYTGFAQTQSGTGTTAPAYSLPDIDGNTVSSASLRDKFVVIHFATTWCPFCNAEAPHLEQLHRDYRDRNVQVLIIDVMEPKKLVAQKLRDRFNLTFPILLDEDGAVATSFAPEDALPDLSRDEVMLASNLIIDPQGKIRFLSLLDSQNFDAKLVELKKVLDALLQEKISSGNTGFIQLEGVNAMQLAAGEEGRIKISFRIKDGYHIQANRINDENLIPAQLTFELREQGITPGEPVFPAMKMLTIEGAENHFWVFDEILEVEVPVKVDVNQNTGAYLMKGILQYQACDDGKCFLPRALEFDLVLTVGVT